MMIRSFQPHWLLRLLTIAFLFSAFSGAAEPAPKMVEGSRPQRIEPLDDGRLTLFPETAEFFGKEIRINPDNFCIAWWSEAADYVAWELELPAAGKYEVWLQWAIADDQAGNPFVLKVGQQQLQGNIGKTGGWTSFGHVSVGELNLKAGIHRLELHAGDKLQGELADVRAITLNPVGSVRPPAAPDFPAKSPATSLAAIRVHPAMQVELVACEPLIRDPIAIAWGADLKLWVVEMGDYPLGTDGKGGQGGRVKILEDTNQDGQYDRSTTFLDGLSFPTGILPWGKGALVTCAPDILYAEDTSGDGKADVKKILFTGFPERNQQHRVNGLRWGLDNWVHCANGDGGVGGETTITSVATGNQLQLGTRDLRFRPETGEIEAQSGPTQFGRNQDDWGNWFGSNNGQPLYHFTLDEHYLARNPRLAPPDPRVHQFNVGGPFFSRAPLIAFQGEQQSLAPATRPVGMGGACSGVIYRDELLGADFAGNALICDPVTNLVHRRKLSNSGVSFTSQRAEDEVDHEFFASTDPWTRPTMVQTGPDGALYLVDMYRLYIEHPQWINASVLERADLRAGNNLGRIYRIYPRNAKPRAAVALDKLKAPALVAAMESPSGWQRDKIQQRIVTGKMTEAAPLLAKLFTSAKSPAVRFQTLATLSGLSVVTDDVLLKTLADQHAAVRRLAVQVAETRLNQVPAIAAKVESLAGDEDLKVVQQVVYSLGEWKSDRAAQLLASIIVTHQENPYVVAAALSSAPGHETSLLMNVLALQEKLNERVLRQVIETCAALDGKDFKAFAMAQLKLTPQQNGTARQFLLLKTLLQQPTATETGWLQELSGPLLKRARTLLEDTEVPAPIRAAAVQVLAGDTATLQDDLTLLAEQLTPTAPLILAEATIDRLSEVNDDSIGLLLTDHWAELSPGLRSRVFDVLMSRADWSLAMLKRFENDEKLLMSLDATRRQRISTHASTEVRKAGGRVLGQPQNSDRSKIVAQYLKASTTAGTASAGEAIFKKNCAACHRLQYLGHGVGPDLAAIKDKSSQAILEAVLNPNRAVEDKFMAYNAITTDGRVRSGLVQVESGNSITLLAAEGQQHVVLRSDLEQLVSTGRSLMPDGFEKTIPPESMRDLLAYLAQAGMKVGSEKAAPAKTITANSAGVLELTAPTATLQGKRVGLNNDAGCIAWMVEGDQATWSVEVPQAAEFEVVIEWAQIDELADNLFEIHVGEKKLTGKFASTQGWSNYRSAKFGTMTLPAGRGTLTLRPAGPVKTELADVRLIKLVPVPSK